MTQVPNDVENRPLERGRIKVMVGPVGLDYPRQAPETLAILGIRTAALPLNLPQRSPWGFTGIRQRRVGVPREYPSNPRDESTLSPASPAPEYGPKQ